MQTVEWWQNAVIYQIVPWSFLDTDSDGRGNLNGSIEKLDYISSLGVDAIGLTPIYESPMDDLGYDITDMVDIDPVIGDLSVFDKLLALTHARGLRMIVDQVWGHTSDRHFWFLESSKSRDNPKADWYVWADPKPEMQGDCRILDTEEPIFAFIREAPQQQLLCMFNLSPDTANFNLSDSLLPCSTATGVEAAAKRNDGMLRLRGYGYFFGNLQPQMRPANSGSGTDALGERTTPNGKTNGKGTRDPFRDSEEAEGKLQESNTSKELASEESKDKSAAVS